MLEERRSKLPCMVLRTAGAGARCSQCQRQSLRIHSHCRRTVADLLWEGVLVRIDLRSRRFFCNPEKTRAFQRLLPHGQRFGKRQSKVRDYLTSNPRCALCFERQRGPTQPGVGHKLIVALALVYVTEVHCPQADFRMCDRS